MNGPNDFPDIDFIGISEDEAEDKLTNKENMPEDVTPDTLEKQGDIIDEED